jgi:hypothetical protein
MDGPSGVVFPATADSGARSTSALGRAVVADALRGVDPVGARAVEHETNWRAGYLVHFRRLVEAGLTSPEAARRIAADGLASLHDRMRVVLPDRTEIGLSEALTGAWPVREPLATVTLTGGGPVERELSLPYRGGRLRGDALARQLDHWVTRGIVEPTCAEAVRRVMANPDWLDLSDLRVVVLGAGAEMGPVHALLRWGGDVIAVDLPRRQIWSRLRDLARRYPGRLHVPVGPAGPATPPDLAALAGQARTAGPAAPGPADRAGLVDRAGADLLHDLPAVAQWLLGFDGRLVIGNYAYADGGTHVRLAAATDALSRYLLDQRDDAALAFLATPTDVYVVPGEAVAHADRAYQRRAAVSRPVRWLTAGRLLRRNYPPGVDPGIIDCLVPQQGPNYALAKRLQRWRATVARWEGRAVSLTVAPMTRTRSVLRNRALAAAYAGAHVFGVEVFEPATSNTLMAALLVHDLRHPAPAHAHPWQAEAANAAHGGVWRVAYAPRSAFGLAALIGWGGARH